MATPQKPEGTNSDSLVLQGELTIYHAESLKAQLLALLQKSGELEVDLHDVTELDSAGIQILMAAKKAAQSRGQHLRLVGHSRPVLEVFELFNLSAFFGDPVLLAGVRATGDTAQGFIRKSNRQYPQLANMSGAFTDKHSRFCQTEGDGHRRARGFAVADLAGDADGSDRWVPPVRPPAVINGHPVAGRRA